MAFEDSPNKQVIRRVWNHAILNARRIALGRDLHYFGMCGPEMRDVIDWRHILSDEIDAVEEPSPRFNDVNSRMYDVSTEHGFRYELMRGSVEYVIANGADRDNARLRRAVNLDGKLEFQYDLINLDFDGGLGNVLARHRAIEALLAAQQKTPFTLLVTYNVRHRVHAAVAQELQTLRGLVGPEDVHIIDWYASDVQPESLRIKAIVPNIIAHAATNAHLDCRTYPPVRYQGHKNAVMVHFAFDLTPRADAFRGEASNARALLTLPFLEAVDGVLRVAKVQDPGFDLGAGATELDFLGQAVRDEIIARRP